MDFQTILQLIAPLVVVLITQGLKKLIDTRYAPFIVILLGAGVAILEQGLVPDAAWIDGIVTTGWVSGLATLIYDFIKRTILDK